MRLAKINLALSVLVTVLFPGFNCHAQPNIPQDKIPSNLAAAVKAEVEGLYAPEAGKRAQAASKLGDMGEKAVPAIPLLIGMLGDSAGIEFKADPESKISHRTSPGIEAAVALGKIGAPALEPLLGALKDKNPHILILAAVALESLKIPRRWKV
jgi:HEAT repeat protein